MRYRVPVLLLLIPLLTPSLQAGFIFGRKKDKIDPKQRVPELVQILKTDKDADKRSKAAEELRNFDPAQFPEILPALIDLNGRPLYLHSGWFLISIGNLVVILAMILVFVLAIWVPFPRDREQE